MNQSQVEGISRIWLAAIASTLGAIGYMKGFDWAPVIALLVPIIGSWWSSHANKDTTVQNRAANDPKVAAVVMKTEGAADATTALRDNPKVVGPSSAQHFMG